MIDPIIITGCARSGTSLTAGIVNICGAFGGDMFGPNKHNQKGMFENKEVRQNIVKPYLKKIGCDPLGQKPLPNNRQVFEVNDKVILEWRTRIQEIYKHQGYKNGEWFYKGAKACLLWYLWHRAFPTAKWVLVRRDDNDIANSCMRTSFMRAYNDHHGWIKWVKKHNRRFEEMKSAGLNVFEFWPSRVISGDYSHAKEMIEYLGLEYMGNEKIVMSFVDPKLYRSSVNG